MNVVEEECRIDQMIHKELKQKPEEKLNDYYERVLQERYNILRDKLLKELRDLKE